MLYLSIDKNIIQSDEFITLSSTLDSNDKEDEEVRFYKGD